MNLLYGGGRGLHGNFRAMLSLFRRPSGVTVFMEPLAVVPLGNRVRELASAERDEVARILAALSGAVGAASEDLTATLDLLGVFDLAAAKASGLREK